MHYTDTEKKTVARAHNGQTLDEDGFVEVTFTLAVDSAISGIEAFSFDIVIVGTG